VWAERRIAEKTTGKNKSVSGSEEFSGIIWCRIVCCCGLQHENSELKKPHSQIHKMLKKAIFDDSMSRTETFEWYSHVIIGSNLIEVLEISGHPL
jgi:hypothetical protein